MTIIYCAILDHDKLIIDHPGRLNLVARRVNNGAIEMCIKCIKKKL